MKKRRNLGELRLVTRLLPQASSVTITRRYGSDRISEVSNVKRTGARRTRPSRADRNSLVKLMLRGQRGVLIEGKARGVEAGCPHHVRVEPDRGQNHCHPWLHSPAIKRILWLLLSLWLVSSAFLLKANPSRPTLRNQSFFFLFCIPLRGIKFKRTSKKPRQCYFEKRKSCLCIDGVSRRQNPISMKLCLQPPRGTKKSDVLIPSIPFILALSGVQYFTGMVETICMKYCT